MPTTLPATTTGGNGTAATAAAVPFAAASYEYSEPMFVDTVTPGASAQEFQHNITPGGFLRGVTLSVQTPTAGTGLTIGADGPAAFFNSISIESIDGTPILYPMGGYAYQLVSKYCRPWDGDPIQDPAMRATPTALTYRIRFFNELRQTLGCMPNTDARALYRIRYSVAPSAQIWTAGTIPTGMTVSGYFEAWAQPDRNSATGAPNVQVPDGLAFQRFVSHEIFPTTGGAQTFKLNRVGNLTRTHILVFRNSSGARVDLTAGPIRWRKDNQQILVETLDRRDYEMWRFFHEPWGFGTDVNQPDSTPGPARPPGVYVYPRWHNVGSRDGQPWLATTEATYDQFEVAGAPAGGSVEVITEDLAPTVAVPPSYLVGL